MNPLAEDALRRLVPNPNGRHIRDGTPRDATFYGGGHGSLVYTDKWMNKNFRHWHREAPPRWKGKTSTGGHLWGSLCKNCKRGFESTNNSTAVRYVAHAPGCRVDHTDGYHAEADMHPMVKDVL